MKFRFLALLSAIVLLFGCEKYDDSGLKSDIDSLKSRVTALEQLCKNINENVSSLQAIVTALQKNDYITGVTELKDNAGYTIIFASGTTINIYNGENGHSPVISVKQDTDGVWYWTVDGEWLYVNGEKVAADYSDSAITPRLKIKDGKWFVSYDNGVSWKLAGEDGLYCGISSVTQDDNNVYFKLNNGDAITIPKRQPLTISFSSSDIAITVAGASKTIDYTLSGATESVVVKSLVQEGWKAKVEPKDYKSGAITITAPDPIVESEVLILVSDQGKTALAALNCMKSTIVISQEQYNVTASGGSIEVPLQTNTDFTVSIPKEAQSWLSFVETKALSSKTLSLTAAANEGPAKRTAVVSLVDDSSRTIQTFAITQSGDLNGLVCIQVDTKGELSTILESYDKANIVKMKITGVLNDVDFTYLNHEMPALRYLDISEVNIDVLPKSCFNSSTNVTDIILPKTLVEISYGCFRNSKIQNVTFGSQLKSIEGGSGMGAFSGCTSIKKITIPASCETIGASSFYNCSSLESVLFEDGSQLKSIEGGCHFDSGAFSKCTSLRKITIPASCEAIGASSFYKCSSLESVLFEDGSQLKSIGGEFISSSYYYGAFSDCTSLRKITIPASCESIEAAAFKGCSSLESVLFEDGSRLKIIGGGYEYNGGRYFGAFSDCTSLRKITIPASCETIEAAAFKNCSSLESVLFEDGSQLKSIEGKFISSSYYYGAFSDCTSLRKITIPASCESIEAAAFKGCSSLESVLFEDSSQLKSIGGGGGWSSSSASGAFSDCTSLKKITIPASCETIEESAFYNCATLTDLSFEANSELISIGAYAFKNNGILHRIYMQSCTKLTSIGEEAFYGNGQIYFLQIGATTPPTLGLDVFWNVWTYSVLKVPAGSESAYKVKSGWGNFSSITTLD